MSKPSVQTIIDVIVDHIEKGYARGETLATIGKKWQISPRTFDRHWKVANEQHAKLQKLAKKAADDAYIAKSAEVAKGAVMSKAERLEILSKIARGELTQKVVDEESGEVNDQPIPIQVADRMKAMAEINKMEGDYAPAKAELTGKDGAAISITLNL